MVKLAAAGNPKFDVSDIEYQSEGKSYTYNTIRKLYESCPVEGKISFIIGSDAFEEIDSWYKAEKLKELVDFIVFERTDDISSSGLREKIKNNMPVNGVVTKEVECYIKEHGLYK